MNVQSTIGTQAAGARALGPRDYHGVNWMGLRTLYQREVRRFWKVALQTVAAHVGVGVSALTYALRPLLRDGLVDLVADLKDKRAKHAVLTASGRERLDEGIKLWSEANRRVETLLGPDDAKLLRSLAERVSSDAFTTAFRSGLW